MSDESVMRNLFDRWERVGHEGQYDLVPECVGPQYIRHDEAGTRRVTREAYAWFRFAFKWTDPKTVEPRSRAGMQSYRIEGGKLVETWLSMQPLGSAWPDVVAQEHWTSSVPIK
jgi:hypothetical protein